MSFRIDVAFLRIALLYVVAGMVMGIFMADSHNHRLMPAHAHIQLLGWATMALYALIYRAWPAMMKSALAQWHFWLANIGALVLTAAITGIYAGYPQQFGLYATIGEMTTMVGVVLFVIIAFRGTSAKAA